MTKVINIVFLLLLCCPVYSQAQQKAERVKIHFALNSSSVDTEFGNNGDEVKRISDLLQQAAANPNISISKIGINSYASPEGGRIYNKQLTRKRTAAIYDYLTNVLAVSDNLIEESHSGIDWDGLRNLVEKSDMEYRGEVLDIINNTPEETWLRVNPDDQWMTLVDSRLKQLQELKYGNPYRYMAANIFSSLRVGSTVTIYLKTNYQPLTSEAERVAVVNSLATPSIYQQPLPVNESMAKAVEVKSRNPIKLAIKTNLLYDLLLTPTVELEVPIGDRWSVAGEWIFPWWTLDDGTKDSARCRLQLLNGNVEGKYWFGDRSTHDTLTGWYCGLYSGAGLYDLEYKTKGYQGELFIAAGLTGGYAHTINKSGSLRMEYSLGVGYMRTNYRYYESVWGDDNRWHPVRQQNGTYTWLGPTRARVSLVWMVGNKSKRGGGL